MLKGPANTFRSRARLAVGLTWVAGYTNVITVLAAGQTVSHQTGNTTHLGEQIGRALTGDAAGGGEAVCFAALVAAFATGAFLSGTTTELARRAGRRSRFVLPMTAEAILLSIVVLLLARPGQRGGSAVAATLLAATAMGLQNGTITRISGAVVRTTHLTGVLTDLGLELSVLATTRRSLHHLTRQPSAQRAALLAAILASFITGATLGSAAFRMVGATALVAPVVFLAALVVREQLARVAEVRPDEAAAEWAGVVPPTVGLFRLSHRTHRPDHPPDFAAWAQGLSDHWRVVVLSVDPGTHFHADAAIGLLTAAALLRAGGRTLVVAGLGRSQLKLLRRHNPHHRLKWADFPPDLEFAVARAINLAADGGVDRDPG